MCKSRNCSYTKILTRLTLLLETFNLVAIFTPVTTSCQRTQAKKVLLLTSVLMVSTHMEVKGGYSDANAMAQQVNPLPKGT